jgi:hypothetical protein
MPIWAAIVLAAAIVVGGRYSLKKLGSRRIEQYEKRLSDRLAAGEDRYFEELRQLQAYDPRKRSRRFNAILEALEIVGGFIALVLLFTHFGK